MVDTRDNREQTRRDDWPDDVNVHPVERVASGVTGAALVALGLLRRGWLGAGLVAAGSGLVHRGATGHCPLYAALRISTAHGVRGPVASVPHGQGVKVKRSLTIRQPVDRVYQVWRQLENLPKLMRHLESVAVLDERRSRWRVA